MIIIVSSLLLGLLSGYYFNFNKNVLKNIDRTYIISVLALLFLMGVSIGNNKEIFSKLHLIGVSSLSLSIFSIIGSIFFVYLIEKVVIN